MDPLPGIHSIDKSTLTPIVRKSVQNSALIIEDWTVHQLGGGAGNPVSVGLFRYEGLGRDPDGGRMNWSVILKVIQSPANVGWENFGEGDDPTHWNYWRREPLIYQSGFLATLPNGLTAPRCFGIVEHPGNTIWMWLENITDTDPGEWTLERYAQTALLLGRFNGVNLLRSASPPYPWLGQQRIRSWLELIPWRTIPWDHHQTLSRYPKPEANPFLQMLNEHERFVTKMDSLPQTICHGDTYPTNFMSRHSHDHRSEIVALDWALACIAPVGADLGQLVFGAQTNLKLVDPNEIDHILFENYMTGLREGGTQLDRQIVRFGYAAFAAMQVGLFQLYFISEAIENGNNTPAQMTVRPSNSDCFEVALAREANKLMEVIL